MYKICFYVPPDYAEHVKNEMFKAGAGKIGNYACCSWQVLGEGQFIPLEGSHPFSGDVHRLERVMECKVEMVCTDEAIQDALMALRESHPYETPAYQVWQLEDL